MTRLSAIVPTTDGSPTLAGAAVTIVSLNHRFYPLLLHQLGGPSTSVSIVQHALHHVVGVAAVPVAVVRHGLSREAKARDS